MYSGQLLININILAPGFIIKPWLLPLICYFQHRNNPSCFCWCFGWRLGVTTFAQESMSSFNSTLYGLMHGDSARDIIPAPNSQVMWRRVGLELMRFFIIPGYTRLPGIVIYRLNVMYRTTYLCRSQSDYNGDCSTQYLHKLCFAFELIGFHNVSKSQTFHP